MKTFISFLILCLIATCNAELRTWTAINGKEVAAEFVSNEKEIVTLKLKSGKLFIVPLNKLSKSDQEFLKAKPSSGPLVDNIVGKVMTFEFEGGEILVQFNGDGRMLAGENGGLKDGGETYKIEGNEVLVFSKGNSDGGISFTSSSPKVGDQVELGPEKEKMRAKITMIKEAIKFESQLVGKWVAKVADAKALFAFPAIAGQKEWSWYNKDKETFPDGVDPLLTTIEYSWEVIFVDPEFRYSFGSKLFNFSDAEGPVKGSLSELISFCEQKSWKFTENRGKSIGSYGHTKVTENKVHFMVTNKTLIDYLLESKPVHVEMLIITPKFQFNKKVAVEYESPTTSKEKHQKVKEEVKTEEPVAEAKPELEGVNYKELEFSKGIAFLKGSDTPYTGKSVSLYANGQKETKGNFKDGKHEGLQTFWYANGQKEAEGNYKDGKLVGSRKYWNLKGEPVDFRGHKLKLKNNP